MNNIDWDNRYRNAIQIWSDVIEPLRFIGHGQFVRRCGNVGMIALLERRRADDIFYPTSYVNVLGANLGDAFRLQWGLTSSVHGGVGSSVSLRAKDSRLREEAARFRDDCAYIFEKTVSASALCERFESEAQGPVAKRDPRVCADNLINMAMVFAWTNNVEAAENALHRLPKPLPELIGLDGSGLAPEAKLMEFRRIASDRTLLVSNVVTEIKNRKWTKVAEEPLLP